MHVLFAKAARVSLLGEAVIPPGTEEIGPRAFDGNRYLKSVTLPGTVKKLGERAFADCVNLQRVKLCEGLRTIGSNCFTGCSRLGCLVVPDSVRELDGRAFYRMAGLSKPVYNASGTVLYTYPEEGKQAVFTVPAGVREICTAAFSDNPHLREVILPEGLKEIDSRAFLDCGLRRITIPASVRRIAEGAFFRCRALEEVRFLREPEDVGEGIFLRCPAQLRIETPGGLREDWRFQLMGVSFLAPVELEYPDGSHCRDLRFQRLAEACARGDGEAMWDMAGYFAGLGDHPFYSCAANFWRYRASQRGCPAARAWVEAWLRAHAGARLPSILNERLSGPVCGRTLYYGGFRSFDPERKYDLSPADRDGVAEVSSWCGDDGPDEDGYGREEYYDWWYLDENLEPLPGVAMLHSYTCRERQTDWQKFRQAHAAAAAAIRQRREAARP